MTAIFSLLFFLFLSSINPAFGQKASPYEGFEEDDFTVGGDIFSDFHQDRDNAQIAEDERFFRYGRFFTFHLSLGLTTFDGNRGKAYRGNPPGYGIGVTYFSTFQTAFGIGFEFSKHDFFLDHEVLGYHDGPGNSNHGPGSVDVSMLLFYFSTRYYLDTRNLGTAITYSNPYFIARLEYWRVTNKFVGRKGIIPTNANGEVISDDPYTGMIANDAGGGLGLGVGLGLEFPIKLGQSYLGIDFLFHTVNFHDKFTKRYAPVKWGSGFGYDDLTGNVWSSQVAYVINW